MGQAKKREKEILELKKYEKQISRNFNSSDWSFDCIDWNYNEGYITGKVCIKKTKHSFSYCLEVLDWTEDNYYFENTLDLYNCNYQILENDNDEYKLNDEVKSFLQDLYNNEDNFIEKLKKDLMKILPIKDFKNAVQDDLDEYDLSDEELDECENSFDDDEPIINPVPCESCEGSGYHYLIEIEEYEKNSDIDLGTAIRCYKCGGDGVHEKGFSGYFKIDKNFVPYKE